MTDQLVVLVADDESDIRHELRDQLVPQRVKVLQARSWKEVLSRIKRNPVQVVVLDLKMPGGDIETAAVIQRHNPHIHILILTAFDSDAYRSRAVAAGVHVDRWLDKCHDWQKIATSAVLEILDREAVLRFHQRIWQWAQKEHVGSKKIQTLLGKYLKPSLLPPALTQAPTQPVNGNPVTEEVGSQQEGAKPELEKVLAELKVWHCETRRGYRDAALREQAWEQFRQQVATLWDACEAREGDRFRQQLADQLDAAVGKIEFHQLRLEHLKAAALSLERLSSDRVGPNDVHDCEKAWRLCQVETLPSLKDILKNWRDWYSIEEEDDD